MAVKLLTEHHLEFLGLKGGCTGSSESTQVKMPHCWKSRVMAKLCSFLFMCYWLVRVIVSHPFGAMGWSVLVHTWL